MSYKKSSLFTSAGDLFGRPEPFRNFGKGPYEEHLCENNSNLSHKLRRCFKNFILC